MKFESKFAIGDLVKFQTPEDKKHGRERFGKVVSARFYRMDAVNFGVEYTIECVNLEPILLVGVYEQQIVKAYH